MIKIVSVETMRKIEAAADSSGISYDEMMQRAGRAAAERAAAMLAGIDGPRVTVLVGPGNNGGDGLVAARELAANMSAEVRLYLLAKRDGKDANFRAVEEAGLLIAYADDDRDNRVLRNMVASADLVIDALFGIGVRLPIRDAAAKVLRNVNQAINERRTAQPAEATIIPADPASTPTAPVPKVLAIDCPSGLDCDTGEVDANTIPADETISFIAAKTGLLLFPGAEHAGQLSVATLGIPGTLDELSAEKAFLADGRYLVEQLPPRPAQGHKGTYGSTLVVAGSVNYAGAAGLAARAAYRAGAGLVTVGAPHPVVAGLSAQISEATWLLLAHDMGVIAEDAAKVVFENIAKYDVLLMGPGWTTEDSAGDFLRKMLDHDNVEARRRPKRSIGFSLAADTDGDDGEDEDTGVVLPPLVIDADGINLLAKMDLWWELLPENTILTPHPGEMARLCDVETSDVQNQRWELVQEKSAAWNAVIVLKGAHTLVAEPGGRVAAIPFKTDALATAGSGDVLAGLIAGLRAQGMDAFAAAVCGAYIHGLAGVIAGRQLGAGRSVIAGDVLNAIAAAFQAILRG